MAATAATLGRRARRRKAASHLPHLWFLTDPQRTPDPAAIIQTLPAGSAVIFRTFGDPDAETTARSLRRLTHRLGLRLLIAADWRLAVRVGACGVHLPQRMIRLAPRLRRLRPAWLITGAAHDAGAILAGRRAGVDALIVSAVFPSRSPSAKRALGVVRFVAMTRAAGVPVIALGGVGDRTAARLRNSGAAGLAGIDVFVGKDR